MASECIGRNVQQADYIKNPDVDTQKAVSAKCELWGDKKQNKQGRQCNEQGTQGYIPR